MADLFTTPEHLEQLAIVQDEVSQTAGSAGPTASDVHAQLYQTHGVIFGVSSDKITEIVRARVKSIEGTTQASADLAVRLRAARETYQGVDEQAGENFDKQISAYLLDASNRLPAIAPTDEQ